MIASGVKHDMVHEVKYYWMFYVLHSQVMPLLLHKKADKGGGLLFFWKFDKLKSISRPKINTHH